MKGRTILVVGATGATGRRVVAELLARGRTVRALVRARDRLPAELRGHPQLEVVEAGILEMDDEALDRSVADVGAVISCLGHNLSFRGIFGPPRRLVTDAVARLGAAIERRRPATPVRFVLMCSAGVRNPDRQERVSVAERALLALLRLLVPPHADNEQAAAFLRRRIGRDHPAIEWAALRPDTLQDEEAVSAYDLHRSPTRSALFNAGRTSRINVADCMARLATDDALWARWRHEMPVIYNREADEDPS